MSGSLISVIVGIAAGITLIVLFSTMFKPDFMLTDEELISKYSKIPEVAYFLEKYPDAIVEVNRNPYERGPSILFRVERQVDPPSYFYTGLHSLGIEVYTNPYKHSLFIYCGQMGMTGVSGLRDISMINEEENECFQTSYREQQFTIAANRVNGMNLGLRQADVVDPNIIEEYWILSDIISQLDEAGSQEFTVVYKNINPDQTTKFLIDDRVRFMQTCFEMVCYDELSSFINLGDDETSYMIRVFAGNDPFHIVGDSTSDADEMGVFEPDDSLAGAVFLSEEK